MKRYILLGAVLFVIMILPTKSVEATTYYVDTDSIGGTCSDVAAGTALSTPWCTVQKAASTAVAGDVIEIRGGTYREVVTPANSGTAGNVITYRSYNSETPIISAANLGTGFTSLADNEVEPTSLFVDGYENNDNTFQNYNSGAGDTVDSGNTLLIQSTTTNNGQYALAASFGGTNRNARVATTLTTPSADVYQRMYFRINSAYNITANDTGQILMNLRIDSSTSRGSVELLQNSSDQFYLRGRAINPSNSSNTIFGATAAGSIVPDTWYMIEYRYKGGDASTGGAELWLNGSSTGSTYTFDTSTTTIGRAEFGGGTSGTGVAAAGSVLYIDDVQVATSSIGAFVPGGSATTYQKTNITTTPYNIFEDGTRLATSSSYASMTAGSFYYDSSSDILYVRTTDSSDPDTKVIDIPQRNEGFLIVDKQYLTFDDLTVQYNNLAGDLDGAFAIGTSSYITVQNSTLIDNFGTAVYVQNTSSSTFLDNTILRNQREFGSGFRLEGAADNLFEGNTITGLGLLGGSGISTCGDCQVDPNTRNTFRANVMSNLRDSCIYLNMLTYYSLIEDNLCSEVREPGDGSGGNGFHIARGSSYSILRNNVMWNLDGHGIQLRSGNSVQAHVTIDGTEIYNNTIFNVGIGEGGSGISLSGTSTNTTIKNNIVYNAGTRAFNVEPNSTSTLTADYNLWYNPVGTYLVRWDATNYTDMATYQAAVPQDANSLNVNPQFISSTTPDFRLATTSPARDSGTTVVSVTDDILGISRPQASIYDMGAYEFVSTSTPDTTAPVISAIATSSLSTTSVTITWTTDEAATSQVAYGTTTSYGTLSAASSSLKTSHSVQLTGLTAATLYHFQVRSTDGSSNQATSSDVTVTTATVSDTTSPVISSISISSITDTGAIVTWTTDEAADSQITYGTSLSYTATTTLDSSLVTSHSVTLSSLTPSTSYNLAVRSQDAASNLATSSNQTFSTIATVVSSSGGGGGGSSRRSTTAVSTASSTTSTTTATVVTGTPAVVGNTAGTFGVLVGPIYLFTTSAEVLRLQKMLASDPSLYPDPQLTGYYGPLTQKAVERFQIKYGIVSSGTPATTGFGQVGPLTLKKLNEVFGGQSAVVPIPTSTQAKIAELLLLVAALQKQLDILRALESLPSY